MEGGGIMYDDAASCKNSRKVLFSVTSIQERNVLGCPRIPSVDNVGVFERGTTRPFGRKTSGRGNKSYECV